MAKTRHPGWSRFVAIAMPFFRLDARRQAFTLLGFSVAMILLGVGLNAVNNYVQRDMMTAIEQRRGEQFLSAALLVVGVFAVLTLQAVFRRYAEETFGIRWRAWLTRHLLDKYLAGRVYYRMERREDIDNPDQRLSEDVNTFTGTALSLLSLVFDSLVTLITFSRILWLISPWLFVAAVLYTVVGTLITTALGRRLVRLDVQQYKKEADFRYGLIRVRTQAEPIALLRGERNERSGLRGRLAAVVANRQLIIYLNRKIGLFTNGYDYLIQLIPILIVAPLYMRGEAEFGKITQAMGAFSFVMNAFSLIVRQFGQISTFGAVIERLGSANEAIEREARPRKATIEIEESTGGLSFEELMLVTPCDGRLLINGLSLRVPRGRRLLVTGPGGTELLRAVAGLWTHGSGRVSRPPLADVAFLPAQPYLTPGSLREQVLYGAPDAVSDERLHEVLGDVGFGPVLERVGGLDAERDWPNALSRGEQQLLAFARLLLARPGFAFLDEATASLEPHQAHHLYDLLARQPLGFVSASIDPSLLPYHDLHLQLKPDGRWELAPVDHAVNARAQPPSAQQKAPPDAGLFPNLGRVLPSAARRDLPLHDDLPFRGPVHHPVDRAPQHADDGPAAQHAQDVGGPDDHRHARRHGPLVEPQRDVLLVVITERHDHPDEGQQEQEAQEAHNAPSGNAGEPFPPSRVCEANRVPPAR
jgi:vitamin B12/bleomycin/antimicrobial peptide transport system ATP-binding/permease protein